MLKQIKLLLKFQPVLIEHSSHEKDKHFQTHFQNVNSAIWIRTSIVKGTATAASFQIRRWQYKIRVRYFHHIFFT
jgi:hypothetical protein